MNNKELYNKIVKILNGEDSEYKNTLETIKKELETEILTSGKINNSIKQAFKRLQKEVDYRTKFKNVLRNGNGLYSITNGFFLVTYTEKQLPNELKPYINPNEKEIDDGFYYEKLKATGNLNLLSLDYEAIKTMYKYNKLNKERNIFTLQNGYTFNIQYFMDILTFLNCKNLTNVKIEIGEHTHAPMNIITENGNAILLPIRMTPEKIDNQLKLQEKVIYNIETDDVLPF